MIAVLMGILAFYIVVGPWALDPKSVLWLLHRDPLQHYTGWVFFRHTPWLFPLGLNPNFGMDIGTSIVFSDSIPLFAIFFKAFTSVLSEPFQYFGYWVLTCFIFQAVFASMLIKLLSKNWLIISLASGIFIFSPIMLYRLAWHMSLMGQFLILAGFYLNFRPLQNKRIMLWALLLSITTLVHFYLLVMVLCLWLASLFDQFFIQKNINVIKFFKELGTVFFCIFITAWLAGYFAVTGKSIEAIGYGISQVNLLALFDPMGWSYLLKWIPQTTGIYEGFNYFGAGAIWIFIFAVISVCMQKRYFYINLVSLVYRHIFLIAFLFFMFLFAVTNNVKIGNLSFTFPISESLLSICSILRASSRMFWPVLYFLMLAIIYFVIKGYRTNTAIAILLVGFSLQAIDTSAGWLPTQKIMHKQSIERSKADLVDPFWDVAGKHYKKVMLKPPMDMPPPEWPWGIFGQYASKYHMGTNSVFLSRPDIEKMKKSKKKFEEILNTGSFSEDTLYILNNENAATILPNLRESDLLTRIDGFNVLAPGWNSCKHCFYISEKLKFSDLLPNIKSAELILFNASSTHKSSLSAGWFMPEDWGVWAEGAKAALLLPLPPNGAKFVQINTRAFISSQHPLQRVSIWANGIFIKQVDLKQGDQNLIDIPIPKQALIPGYVRLEFEFFDRIRPMDTSNSKDDRYLSIGLISAIMR